MGQFVQRGPVEIDRLEKARLIGDANAVICDVIIGMAAAALKAHAACLNKGFGGFNREALRDVVGLRVILKGEVFALGDVEDREALQKGDAARAVFDCRARRILAGLFGDKAVGINDRCAAFALLDIATQRERLLECQPLVDFVLPRKQRIPQ